MDLLIAQEICLCTVSIPPDMKTSACDLQMTQIPICDPSKGFDQEVQWIDESEWSEASSAGRIRAELFYRGFEARAQERRRQIENELVRKHIQS